MLTVVIVETMALRRGSLLPSRGRKVRFRVRLQCDATGRLSDLAAMPMSSELPRSTAHAPLRGAGPFLSQPFCRISLTVQRGCEEFR
jgi:hypothetical protein